MFRFCLSLCIFIVLIGCQPAEKPPEPSGNDDQKSTKVEVTDPVGPTEGEDTKEFLERTKAYNMLGVQESKDWLRDNSEYTGTEIDDNTLLIQKNGAKITMSKETRGLASIEGTVLTDDHKGNIRVGFFR